MSDAAVSPPAALCAPGRRPAVSVRGLTVRFPDGTTALRAVDLDVHPGEIVAVMGRSGAGKSTLVKCLSLVLPALEPAEVSGERRLFGEPAQDLTPASLADRVGVVFQDFEAQLFSTNVGLEIGFGLDQLGRPPAEIRARTAAALDRVGLGGFAARDPATLSGGEKQRLAMAAIWALGPELVLLDEPTTDVDPLGKRAIFDLLRAFRDAGAAVVVVEHEPAAALAADRLLLLDGGRVCALGASAEVMRRVDLLAACGVRAREIDEIAAALGVEGALADLDAAEAALRARAVARRSPRPAARREARAALVELCGVRHEYGTGRPALDDASLAVGAGEFVALVGHNGSGKTTLAKHMNGLLAPTAGRVLVDGRDVAELGLSGAARVVGFVFQDPDHQLFAATVEEEVAFGPRHLGLERAAVEARVARCLALTGLGDRRDADPFLLGKGERQRLAIAAVLALEPRLLVLDEPTTGLDCDQQRALLELLRDLHRSGTSIVAITHAPWLVAEFAERAVLMADGRVVFDGPVADLFAAPDLLRAASFERPESVELAARLGVGARSVADLLEALGIEGGRR